MYEINVKTSFSAAHLLKDHNGPCGKLHGHNWDVEAVFASAVLDPKGMVADFHEIETALAQVIAVVDHKNLNDIPPFDSRNPTAERIAEWIYHELKRNLKIQPARITVRETEKTSATYVGE